LWNWIQENVAASVLIGGILALFSLLFNFIQSVISHRQTKRMEAVEGAWDNLTIIKEKINSVITFYTLYYADEYNKPPIFTEALSFLEIDILSDLQRTKQQLIQDRIYTGEEFYTLCKAYFTFIRRLTNVTKEGIASGEIKPWTENRNIMSAIEFILPPEYLLTNLDPMKINHILDYCETKILIVGRRLISGEQTAYDNFGSIERLRENVLSNEKDIL
jgi:hypothetical protein